MLAAMSRLIELVFFEKWVMSSVVAAFAARNIGERQKGALTN